jgi:hypothetical protein
VTARESEREIERDLGRAATVDSDQVCLLYVLVKSLGLRVWG